MQVTIFYKDSWYYLKDEAGNYLQSNSFPGVNTVVFGSFNNAVARSTRTFIQDVAAQYNLEIVQSLAEILFELVSTITFVVGPISMIFGVISFRLYFTTEASPPLLLYGIVFSVVSLVSLAIFWHLLRNKK